MCFTLKCVNHHSRARGDCQLEFEQGAEITRPCFAHLRDAGVTSRGLLVFGWAKRKDHERASRRASPPAPFREEVQCG